MLRADGLRRLHPPDELSHVVPRAHPQQSGELAVNRVLHDYVHHLAPASTMVR